MTTARAGLLVRASTTLAGRMKIAPKLAALIALLVLPTVFAGGSYFTSVNEDATFTRSERAGVEMLAPALRALVTLADGDAALPDLGELRDAAARHPEFELDAPIAAAEQALAGDSTDARAAGALALESLIATIGNESGLVLDPDLDSYYVMDALVFTLPHAIASHLVAHAAYYVIDDAKGTGAESLLKSNVATQAVLAGVLASAGDRLATNTMTASEASTDATLAEQLVPLADLSNALISEAATLQSMLDNPAPSDFLMVQSSAAKAIDPSLAALDRLLAKRLAGIESLRNATLAGITGVTLVALAWAVVVWVNTRHGVRLASSAVLALARKDLTPQPLPPGKDEFAEIGVKLGEARTQLAGAFVRLADASGQVAAAANQLTSTTMTVDNSAHETRDQSQSAAKEIVDVQQMLSAVSDSGSHLASATVEISHTMAEVNESAQRARADLEGAADLAAQLGESSKRISASVDSIVDIASKTRLLALNATIEAARAGDAGRGFAVVAAEVQALAQQSANASVLIGEVADEQHAEITKVIEALARAAAAVSASAEAQATVAAAAEQQTATISEVTDSITGSAEAATRIAEQVARVEHVAKGTAGTVSELRHAAQEFDGFAKELAEEVEAFTLR